MEKVLEHPFCHQVSKTSSLSCSYMARKMVIKNAWNIGKCQHAKKINFKAFRWQKTWKILTFWLFWIFDTKILDTEHFNICLSLYSLICSRSRRIMQSLWVLTSRITSSRHVLGPKWDCIDGFENSPALMSSLELESGLLDALFRWVSCIASAQMPMFE